MDFDLPLSPKQLRSIAEATASINVWEGSVRSGKTLASLIRWLIYVADAPTGGELIMVGKTRETIERNAIAPLMDPAVFGRLANHVSHTTGSNIAIILGRTVHLIGANDTKAEGKLRGMTCAGAYVDEVTILPESVWRQLLARLSVPGAMLFATTNPDGPRHWFKVDFLDAGLEHLRSWQFTIDDNPGLTEKFIRDLKAANQGLWYKRNILGLWVAAGGSIFDMWDEARHVIGNPDDVDAAYTTSGEPMRFDRWWLGVDYGTTNPFAAVLLGLVPDGRIVAVDEWRWDSKARQRQLTDAEYSERLARWLTDRREAWGVELTRVFIDPSAASFKVQLNRDGQIGVNDANNDVLDGIRTMASLLGQGRHQVHARCAGLRTEMPGYRWDDKATQRGEDAPVKLDDHSVDADRYGVHTGKWIWRQTRWAPPSDGDAMEEAA